MDHVYLRRGFSGEYGDRCDWVVAAYLDRAGTGPAAAAPQRSVGPLTPLSRD